MHGPSVFGRTISAGLKAAVYVDAMPRHCALVSSGRYAVKHNPWPYFVDERALCRKHDLPVAALGADVDGGTLPNAAMVVPDLCHDAHDCSLATADPWFQGWMTQDPGRPGLEGRSARRRARPPTRTTRPPATGWSPLWCTPANDTGW